MYFPLHHDLELMRAKHRRKLGLAFQSYAVEQRPRGQAA